ncbi:MAG: dihydrolipoyllysine-residue succinyltransferase [Phycisphaeraceae bacterium]|nr:dihydrolipoyllysine-residue succinyltransferase [Phycisphaeraceae bacterium]
MALELKVPTVGESITEVQIGRWHKSEGDSVAKDETIVEIETDKVTVELPAPVAGTIGKIIKKTGEAAAVGDVIGMLDANGSASTPAQAPPKSVPAPSPTKPAPTAKEAPPSAPVKPAAAAPTTAAPIKPQVAVERTPPAGDEEIIPMTPLRRRIAERLVEAQHSAALLTTFNEVDMSAVMALRAQLQEAFQAAHQVKLGFMSFFVKAAIHALKLVPQVNSEIRGTDVIYKNHYDIGIAIGGGKGLVVPVLRRAERMSFAEIEKSIAEFAARAKENKIALEELQGGTFTISNGGVYGSLLSTPIVNPPQSGILGLHAIQDRPIAKDKQVVIRPMMYMALTYDHRVIDGREAVTFLKSIKEVIEEPARMLVEV